MEQASIKNGALRSETEIVEVDLRIKREERQQAQAMGSTTS
ncbi:hypothetical protein ACOI1H_13745 [Loktanella sp. DJP18]